MQASSIEKDNILLFESLQFKTCKVLWDGEHEVVTIINRLDQIKYSKSSSLCVCVMGTI